MFAFAFRLPGVKLMKAEAAAARTEDKRFPSPPVFVDAGRRRRAGAARRALPQSRVD